MTSPQRRGARPILSAAGAACSFSCSLRPLALACAAWTSVAAAPALAQSSGDGGTASRAEALDPVIITATRTPQRVSKAIADVTVFGREEIERRPGASVADLLRTAAGLEITRNGGPTGTTSCFVRGAESRFLAVLVDGVRMDSQSVGGAPWEAIPLFDVERIEVVRGGAGAIYGSDAMGGVVQIITRKGQKGTSASVAAGLGSRNLRRAEARLSGGNGEFDYALGLGGERSGGFSAIGNPAGFGYSPDDDGYATRGGSARLGWQLTSTQRLEAGVTGQHSNTQYDGSPPTQDHHAFHNTSAANVNWTAQWTPEWRSQLTLGQSVDQYKTRPSVYDSRTRLRTATWLNTYALGEHTLSAVLERREDHLENSSLAGGVGDRSQNAIGLGDLWNHGPWVVQAHWRHDRDSEFGGRDTGLLGAAYEFAPGWRARASASNSFRAPTLYNRFSQYGKAELKPEAGFNVEAGLNWRDGVHEAGLTVYRNRVRNLIVFGAAGPCSSPFGCYDNVGVARLQGVTLDGRTEIGPVRLSGSADMLSPRNADTGNLLARRARRHASLRADMDLGAWTVGAQVLASGKRYDAASNAEAGRLAGYTVLNLDAQWRFAREWRLESRVDNVFNQAYETARYYTTQPRLIYVGVRWTPI